MEQEENKTKINKWGLGIGIGLVILAIVIMMSNLANASATNNLLEQKTMQFIYTGKLYSEAQSPLEMFVMKNRVANEQFIKNYFDKYGFWNYYINIRGHQLFN